ncbi:MAG: ABC transporter permease, partial [SAR324 cluster bacterium]|nr:ABC transporter permease [SAR324 cluster bacterium]
MYRYLIQRVLLMIPTLFGVAVIIFILMRLIPGDIAEIRLAETGNVSQEMIDLENERLGLNRPYLVQFGDWMFELLKGNLGESMWTGRPMILELEQRFQISLQLALMATFFATILAIPLGTLAALRQDTWVDYFVRIFSIAGIATPSFWLGIMMILGLLIFFNWVPPLTYTPIWVDPITNLSQLIWPAAATGYRYSAVATRMTRSAVL